MAVTMNARRFVPRISSFIHGAIAGCSRDIQTTAVYSHQSYKLSDDIYKNMGLSSLWYTTVPTKLKNKLKRRRKSERKQPHQEAVTSNKVIHCTSNKTLIISCKRSEDNHFKGTSYGKLDIVRLTSKGWTHKKSKGDYFSILPINPNLSFSSKFGEIVADDFKQLKVCDQIIEQLQNHDIQCPTAIQSSVIPKLLKGKSIIMVAETGSGKTLAYVIPMLQRILKLKKEIEVEDNTPLGLIVVPTKELVLQIHDVVNSIGSKLGIKCKELRAERIRKTLINLKEDSIDKVDILVTTLGIICKFTYYEIYNISKCAHVVFDEADTLLDDSFNEKLKVLMKRLQIRTNRDGDGTLLPSLTFVSATVPTDFNNIVDEVVPVTLLEKITSNRAHRVMSNVRQNFIRCSKLDKPRAIIGIARKDKQRNFPLLIFCNDTETCIWVSEFLKSNKIASEALHSNLPTDQRVNVLKKFKEGIVDVLCCTDLASRGFDLSRVQHVVNYNFPMFMADYVHRCGRTGRLGSADNCEITNLISSPREVPMVQEIEKTVRMNTKLENVNNNITRILEVRTERKLNLDIPPPAKPT